ncbi:unnamed protein product, partial [Chrysoparadoxa australica]
GELFQNLPALVWVYLDNNQLSGPIPGELFQNLLELREVYLSNNQLSGPIPGELFQTLLELREVDLDNNQLSGPIPGELFQNLPALGRVSKGLQCTACRLHLHESLTCSCPSDVVLIHHSLIPVASPDLHSFQVRLDNNQLSGPIPGELFQTLPALRLIDLWGNKLWGSLDSPRCTNITVSPERLCLKDATDIGGPSDEVTWTQLRISLYCALGMLMLLISCVVVARPLKKQGGRRVAAALHRLFRSSRHQAKHDEIILQMRKYLIYATVSTLVILLGHQQPSTEPTSTDIAALAEPISRYLDKRIWTWNGAVEPVTAANKNAAYSRCFVDVPSAGALPDEAEIPAWCQASCELLSFNREAVCRFTVIPPESEETKVWSFEVESVTSLVQNEELTQLHSETCVVPPSMVGVTQCKVECKWDGGMNTSNCTVLAAFSFQDAIVRTQELGRAVYSDAVIELMTGMIGTIGNSTQDRNEEQRRNFTEALNTAACNGRDRCKATECTGFTAETVQCKTVIESPTVPAEWSIALVIFFTVAWFFMVCCTCSGKRADEKWNSLSPPACQPVNATPCGDTSNLSMSLKERNKLLTKVWEGCCRGGDIALVFMGEDVGVDMDAIPPHWKLRAKDADVHNEPLYHVCITNPWSSEDIVRLIERVADDYPVGMILKAMPCDWEIDNVMLHTAQSSHYRAETPLLGNNVQTSKDFRDWWEGYSVAESMGVAFLAWAVAGAMWASGRAVYPTLFALAHGNGLEQEASIGNILWLLSRCLPRCCWADRKWCPSQGLRTHHKTLQVVILLLAVPGLVLELNRDLGKIVAAGVYIFYGILQIVYAVSWLCFSKKFFGKSSLTPNGACESGEQLLLTLATEAKWHTAMLLSEEPGVRCCDKDGTLLSSMGASSAARRRGERYAHCGFLDQTKGLQGIWSASFG